MHFWKCVTSRPSQYYKPACRPVIPCPTTRGWRHRDHVSAPLCSRVFLSWLIYRTTNPEGNNRGITITSFPFLRELQVEAMHDACMRNTNTVWATGLLVLYIYTWSLVPCVGSSQGGMHATALLGAQFLPTLARNPCPWTQCPRWLRKIKLLSIKLLRTSLKLYFSIDFIFLSENELISLRKIEITYENEASQFSPKREFNHPISFDRDASNRPKSRGVVWFPEKNISPLQNHKSFCLSRCSVLGSSSFWRVGP